MGQMWLYWVPVVLQRDGKTAFHARLVEMDRALNTPQAVIDLIDTLTAEYLQGEPEEGELPVLPLTWTLVTAKRGPAVGGNGSS
jgi:hypothetical protein